MAAGVSTELQPEPLLPAETTTSMPAARTFSTTVFRTLGSVQPSLGGQPQELLMTCGALVGSGFWSLQVRRRDEPLEALGVASPGVPLPWSMFRQPIHFAPGAMPIWLPPPSSPTIVPIVCVPWSVSSHGATASWPQLPPPEWIASCQL